MILFNKKAISLIINNIHSLTLHRLHTLHRLNSLVCADLSYEQK